MSQPIITPEIRALVAQQSAYQCRYCLSQEDISGTRFTVDHIIPKSLGGETVLGNPLPYLHTKQMKPFASRVVVWAGRPFFQL